MYQVKIAGRTLEHIQTLSSVLFPCRPPQACVFIYELLIANCCLNIPTSMWLYEHNKKWLDTSLDNSCDGSNYEFSIDDFAEKSGRSHDQRLGLSLDIADKAEFEGSMRHKAHVVDWHLARADSLIYLQGVSLSLYTISPIKAYWIYRSIREHKKGVFATAFSFAKGHHQLTYIYKGIISWALSVT